MDRMLYTAMNTASNIGLAQANNANNLANSHTPGFKADLDALKSLPVYGPGHATRVVAQDQQPGSDLRSGPIRQTGRDLDLAVSGEGWLTVLSETGQEAYSRRGDLRIDVSGLLIDGAGRAVLGEGGPITVPPHEGLVIGRDGSISIQPLGQAANTLAVIDRIRLVSAEPTQLEKGLDGLFRSRDGQPLPADAGVEVFSGALESSNVNAVESMVKMIELARSFEAQVKLMKLAQDNDAATDRLLRQS